MTVMLRLDPDRPPLWRDHDQLQFGVTADVIVEPVTAWQQRLLFELERGISESGLDALAEQWRMHPRVLRAFVTELGPIVRRSFADGISRALRVAGFLARSEAREAGPASDGAGVGHEDAPASDVATEREGAPELSPAAPPDLTRLLLAAIGGDRERFVLVERDTALDEIDVAVVIADGALDPTELAPLVGADVPHLPVVPRPGGVDVGPLVVPGESACFSCVELERSERDAAWPAIADQLREARPRPLPTERALRAAAAALDLLDEAWRGRTTGAVITIERETRARIVPPHAACGCRAPQRSASAPAASAAEHADRPVRTLPTTERAHAVPA